MMIVVLTTVPDAGEGEILAEKIVGERLAACVQVLPGMSSVYLWEGKIHSESEHLLLIKTVEEQFEALSEFITANHSYEVPEIIAIPAVRVSESYLGWVMDYLR